MNCFKYLTAFSVFSLFAGAALPAHAITVDFRDDGDFTTSSFSEGNLTATDSGNAGVRLNDSNGIGVVGGDRDDFINPGETFVVDFDDPVTDVFIDTDPTINNFDLTYEAFDANQSSLGSVTLTDQSFNLSDELSLNQPMSSFTATGDGGASDGANIGAVSSKPVPPVPFHTDVLPGLLALGGFLIYRHRKKRKQALSQ